MKKHGDPKKDQSTQRSEAHSGTNGATAGKKTSHQDQNVRNTKDINKQAKKATEK
jgi:hypothetical protein